MIARSSSCGVHGGDDLGAEPNQLAERLVAQWAVVEVGSQGGDHPHRRVRVVDGVGDRTHEAVGLVGCCEREQFFELVDDDHDLGGRLGHERGDRRRDPVGGQLLREPRRRVDGDRAQALLECIERVAAGDHGGDEPLIGALDRPGPQGGHDTGADHARLARTAGPDHRNEPSQRAAVAETGEEPFDQAFASEEAVGLALVERVEAAIRVRHRDRSDLVAGCAGGIDERREERVHIREPIVGIDRCRLGDHRLGCGAVVAERIRGHAPQRVQIGSRVRLRVLQLLGSDELGVVVTGPRHPEVGEVGVVPTVDEHVLGLHVAMGNTLAMGGGQGVADLHHHTRGGVGRDGFRLDEITQVAALEQPGDEMGGVGLAPVVEDGHDLRMLETGALLCPRLEASDEGRVVGELGADHLDRDVTPHRRLEGAVDAAHRSVADPFPQLVAAYRQPGLGTVRERSDCAALSEFGIVEHDLFLDPADPGRWFEPQLVREVLPVGAERAERVALPTREMQRQHQMAGQPLSRRVLTHQALQLPDDFACPPGAQVGIDAILDRGEAELFEASDLRFGERFVHELLEGVPAPQTERFIEHQRRRRRIRVQQRPTLGVQTLEPDGVDVVGIDRQHIPRRTGSARSSPRCASCDRARAPCATGTRPPTTPSRGHGRRRHPTTRR